MGAGPGLGLEGGGCSGGCLAEVRPLGFADKWKDAGLNPESVLPISHLGLAPHTGSCTPLFGHPLCARPGGHSHGRHEDKNGCAVESVFWYQGAFHVW